VKSILIVHQGAIGDFVLSLPALEALHSFYPEARFSFLANPNILESIRARPYFDKVLDCSESRWSPLYRRQGKLAKTHLDSLLTVDSIFVFGRSTSQILADSLASHLGKPAHRIDPFPESDLGLGLADHQCRQLEALGVPATPPPAAVISPLPQDSLEARAFVRGNLAPGDRLILLHPGSGSEKKLWKPAGWANLIHRLSAQQNLRLALLQGPADSNIVQQLRLRLEPLSPILVENWRLGKLAALLNEAALYLGNDSGISHLAAACGTPTIALFGPTDPRIWAPIGPRVRIVHWQPENSASDHLTGPGSLTELPLEVELVWKQAREWLESG
jgi:ADP-heptose:LPS heptosyltransferase